MATKHVVLGLLIERPGYGYELQQRIDGRFGFLGLAENTVYGVLGRLENDSLIQPTGRTTAKRRGSPRIPYSVTEAGVGEFRDWMSGSTQPAVVREELHVKLLLADPNDLPSLIAQTVDLERCCLAELTEATSFARERRTHDAGSWAATAGMLVDEAVAGRLRSSIDWLQRVRAAAERQLAETPAHLAGR